MCHLLALLGAHPILHVSWIRVKCECSHQSSCSSFAAVLTQRHFFLPITMVMMVWGYWWNNECQSNNNQFGDPQSPRSPVHHKSQVACPGTEPGPVRRTVSCTRAAMNPRQAELFKQSTGWGEPRCTQRSNYSDERAIWRQRMTLHTIVLSVI